MSTDYERIRENLYERLEGWREEEYERRSEAEWTRRLEGTEADTEENRKALEEEVAAEIEKEAWEQVELDLKEYEFDEDGYLIEDDEDTDEDEENDDEKLLADAVTLCRYLYNVIVEGKHNKSLEASFWLNAGRYEQEVKYLEAATKGIVAKYYSKV